MEIADTRKLADDLAAIDRALTGNAHVLVAGPIGSGRGTLFAELARREDVIAVEAPSLSDADALAHVILHAAAQLSPEVLQEVAGTDSIEARVKRLSARVFERGRTLALRLPSSWRNATRRSFESTPDQRFVGERATRALHSLGAGSARVIVLADTTTELEGWARVPLTRMEARVEALEDAAAWGAYAPFAREVMAAVETTKVKPTPLQARLAVGLVALGQPPSQVIGTLQRAPGSSLVWLLNRLTFLLQKEQPSFGEGLARVALARFGLSRARALALAALPSEHASLVTDCLAYGDQSTLTMSEPVRLAVAKLGRADDLERVHRDLAHDHAQLDGTSSMLRSPSPHDWLERLFHLSLAGDHGAGEWAEMEKLAPELYWERGRALSLAGRFEAAAEVYDECRSAFGLDDYAHHYYAFNRDRAGFDDTETEGAYRRAIELSPSHAWWNGRLVTYLVATQRYLAAREAWAEAIAQVDPEGVGGVWIAKNFHRWVVRAWLECGEVELAREAFEVIPDDVQGDESLRPLARELHDMEETARLGESVYPPTTPIEERWLRPALVPARGPDGEARIAWYPSRVVEADEERVLLALGVPNEDEGPRTMLKVMTAEDWRAAAHTNEAPNGYWELGSYQSGLVFAFPRPRAPSPTASAPDPARFARRRQHS